MQQEFNKIEDFLANPYFVQWVKSPDATTTAYWETWISQHPALVHEFETARSTIASLDYKYKYSLSQTELDEMYLTIKAFEEKHKQEKTTGTIRFFYTKLGRAAASVALIGSFATSYLFLKNKQEQPNVIISNYTSISTTKGQHKLIVLPDGSRVTLNALSSLTYPNHFRKDKRIVQLKGEAFFNVVKNPHQPFVVKTKDIQTQVLGTSFNIRELGKETKVAVVTGKVRVTATNKLDEQILTPNKMAIWRTTQKHLETVAFSPKEEVQWKEKVLYFEEVPLDEVFKKLETVYHVQIIIEPNASLTGKYNGEFVDESLDNVMAGLAYTSNFHYRIEDKKITIFN